MPWIGSVFDPLVTERHLVVKMKENTDADLLNTDHYNLEDEAVSESGVCGDSIRG
jgi:hypothetical protein